MKTKTLTAKQLEILALVAVGDTDEEIADKLRMSLPVVKTEIKKILEKIGILDRLQAAFWAAKNL